jgi:hypothetical protein
MDGKERKLERGKKYKITWINEKIQKHLKP